MIFYEPGRRDRSVLPHDPFKALVVPRPIGWISTMDAAGRVNLAPYSFCNAVGEGPYMLAFSSHGAKDSSTFAGELREFVWNLVTWELREHMNETSAPLARGDSEFSRAGLEMAPSGSGIDTAGLRPIARCGGPGDYTVVERIFQMTRPTS